MSQASYDRLAPVYDLVAGSFEWPMVQRGLALLEPRDGEAILEVGHGPGRALEVLAKSVGDRGRVVGVDFSSGMGRVAAKRLATAGLTTRVELRSEDATAAALAAGSFDGIFSAFMLDIFETATAVRVIASWRAALRPGGRLVLVNMAQGAPGTIASLYAWSHRHFPAVVDCRPINPPALARQAGFAEVTSSTHRMFGLPVAVTKAR